MSKGRIEFDEPVNRETFEQVATSVYALIATVFNIRQGMGVEGEPGAPGSRGMEVEEGPGAPGPRCDGYVPKPFDDLDLVAKDSYTPPEDVKAETETDRIPSDIADVTVTPMYKKIYTQRFFPIKWCRAIKWCWATIRSINC